MNLKCTKWMLMRAKIILTFLGQTKSFLEPCPVIQHIKHRFRGLLRLIFEGQRKATCLTSLKWGANNVSMERLFHPRWICECLMIMLMENAKTCVQETFTMIFMYSRVRNKRSPTIIKFLTFFQGLRPYSGLHSIR